MNAPQIAALAVIVVLLLLAGWLLRRERMLGRTLLFLGFLATILAVGFGLFLIVMTLVLGMWPWTPEFWVEMNTPVS